MKTKKSKGNKAKGNSPVLSENGSVRMVDEAIHKAEAAIMVKGKRVGQGIGSVRVPTATGKIK